MTQYSENDVNGISNLLNYYIPNFIKMFNPSITELKKILDVFYNYEKLLTKMYNDIGDVDIIIDGAIPISIHIMETRPNEKTEALLNFIDLLCEQLLKILSDDKLKMIKRNILNPMIYNKKLKLSRFMTALGELAILNQLIDGTTYENKIVLDKCEAELPNKKKIDFLFKVDNKKIYVEVLNFLDVRSDLIDKSEDLNKFFKYRLEEKLVDKLKDLEYPNKEFGFILQPIIWGDIDNLRKYKKFFIEFDNEYDIISPICLLGPYRDPLSKKLLYKFEPVSQRFNYYDEYYGQL